MHHRRGLLLVATAFLAHGAPCQERDPGASARVTKPPRQGERQEPPSAAEQLARFTPADDFAVELFADESLGVVNPIQIAWDPAGRLWVCCAPSYPHADVGVRPDDYVLVLEDVDGDGRADRSTKFADGLYIPTGFELGDGGCYVASAPDLWFFRDTDGDDRADERELVFTGFGTEDSHHSISTFRWGPDGFLYFQEGTFFHSQVETPRGLVTLVYGGVFRTWPRARKLEVFADCRVSNPWGHLIDDWGEQLLVDNPRITFMAPVSGNGSQKVKEVVLARAQKGKTCGGTWLSGRHLPERLHGQFALPSYQAHAIFTYGLRPDGAGYAVENGPALLASPGPFFRPVGLEVGPDGALWICDWFNQVIGHTQHDVRDPRRDRAHGRIWRLRHASRPLVAQPRLVGVPLKDVVTRLGDPEQWTRNQARRVLYDADRDDAATAIDAWVAALEPNDDDAERLRVQALFAYRAIGVQRPALVASLLEAGDHRARTAALRALRDWQDDRERTLAWLERAVADSHPRVRLEAVLTAGFVPDARAVTIAAQALDAGVDRFIQPALAATIDGLRPQWLAAHERGELTFANEVHRERVLAGVDATIAVAPLIKAIRSAQLDDVDLLVAPLAGRADAAAAGAVWSAFADVEQEGRLPPVVIARVLLAFEEAARVRGVKPTAEMRNLDRLARFEGHAARVVRASASLVGTAWRPGRKRLDRDVFVAALSANGPLADRIAAALAARGRDACRPIVTQLSRAPSLVQRGRAAGLAAAAGDDRAPALAASVCDAGSVDPRVVVAPFLARAGGAALLGRALAAVDPQKLTDVRRYLNEVGEQDPVLRAAVSGVTASLTGRLLAGDRTRLLADIFEHGDATRGAIVFARPQLACVVCHAVGGGLVKIGPDLAVVGATGLDYVVDSLLEPSKVIKDLYKNVRVTRNDGTLVAGILIYEDQEKIVVRAAAGDERTVLAGQVRERQDLPSLMPPGLVDGLTRQEFLDLARYLDALR